MLCIWQASWAHLDIADECYDAVMAPSGQHLVAIIGSTAVDSAQNHACIYQYDLDTHRGHIVAPGYSIHFGSTSLMMDWALIPGAWPRQLYAYVHDTLIRPTGSHTALHQSIRLIDSSTHNILGSWKVANGTLAADQQDPSMTHSKVDRLEWSRNGKHLATFCTNCVQLLSFDPIE